MKRSHARTLATLLFLLHVTTLSLGSSYIATPIAVDPSSSEQTFGTDLNAAGEVSGYTIPASVSAPNAAFIWSAAGGLNILPQDSRAPSPRAFGINDSSQLCGGGFLQPLLWSRNAGTYSAAELPDINAPTGGSEGVGASAINNHGSVIGSGYAFGDGGGTRGYLWRPTTANGITGTIDSLGGGGGLDVNAADLNDNGLIVGSANTQPFGTRHAAIWKSALSNGAPGTLRFISQTALVSSFASGCNASDVVVGTYATASGNNHGFVWTPTDAADVGGTLSDLGTLTGLANASSTAVAINDLGMVTGAAASADGTIHAFIWTSADGMKDLNDLVTMPIGWVLRSAVSINDAGMILTYATYDPDGPGGIPAISRGVLLTAVPEPTTTLGVAVFGTLIFCRRRRNTSAGAMPRESPEPSVYARRASLCAHGVPI